MKNTIAIIAPDTTLVSFLKSLFEPLFICFQTPCDELMPNRRRPDPWLTSQTGLNFGVELGFDFGFQKIRSLSLCGGVIRTDRGSRVGNAIAVPQSCLHMVDERLLDLHKIPVNQNEKIAFYRVPGAQR